MNKYKVSAIVPVYNEVNTVSEVLDFLTDSALIDEVICVDDGSTDGSKELLRRYGRSIIFIDLEKNKGKGFALASGIESAKGDIVVFFDADLLNLSTQHIESLIGPLLEGEAHGVLGYPGTEEGTFSKLTGERAYFKEDLLEHLPYMKKTRFGVEIYLNSAFAEDQILFVPLVGLNSIFKYQKRSLPVAVREYLNEAVEVALEIGKREGIRAEERLRVKNILKSTNLKEFRSNIKLIRNRRISRFLNSYLNLYSKLKEFWQDAVRG